MVAELEPGAAGEIVRATLTFALRAITCGELGASSAIVMNASRGPTAIGENDTQMVHVALTGDVAAAQWLVRLLSLDFAHPSATGRMRSGSVPGRVVAIILE